MIRREKLYQIKEWVVLLISDEIPKWLKDGDIIEKKDLSMAAQLWFGFTSISITPNQNESILQNVKASCVGCSIGKIKINLGMIIS